jgi:hypothetical protein
MVCDNESMSNTIQAVSTTDNVNVESVPKVTVEQVRSDNDEQLLQRMRDVYGERFGFHELSEPQVRYLYQTLHQVIGRNSHLFLKAELEQLRELIEGQQCANAYYEDGN